MVLTGRCCVKEEVAQYMEVIYHILDRIPTVDWWLNLNQNQPSPSFNQAFLWQFLKFCDVFEQGGSLIKIMHTKGGLLSVDDTGL